MNPKIAAIAKQAAGIESGHDHAGVLDAIRDLAGGQDPILYLLSEVNKGIEGRLVIRQKHPQRTRVTAKDLDVTLDGLRLPPWFHFNMQMDVSNPVLRCGIGFYPSEVDVDATVLFLLQAMYSDTKSDSVNGNEQKSTSIVPDDPDGDGYPQEALK